jgi:hypothetical protein
MATSRVVPAYRNERDGRGFVRRVVEETEASVVRRILPSTPRATGSPALPSGSTWIAYRRRGPHRLMGVDRSARSSVGRPTLGVSSGTSRRRLCRRGTKAQRRRPEGEWMRRDAPDLRIVSAELGTPSSIAASGRHPTS